MPPPVLTSAPFLPQINASPDVITAMTMYQLSMLKSYSGLQPPQLVQMGMRDTTSSLAYKLPVSLGSSLFRLLTGGVQYRRLGKLLLAISTAAYGDGVAAEGLDIESDEWKGWGDQPESMGLAANLIGEVAIATAIEAGETTDSIENFVDGDTGNTGIKFFGQNKDVDPLGGTSKTYSNLLTGAGTTALANVDAAAPLNLANIDRVWSYTRSIPAQNGVHYQDLTWGAVLVSTAQELQARRYFEDQGSANDQIFEPTTATTGGKAAGSDVFPKPNTAKGRKVQVIASPYLTNPTTWYPILSTSTQKKAPWIELTQVPARLAEFAGARQPSPQTSNGMGDIQWVIDDYTSEGYKHGTETIPKGYIGMRAEKRVGAALLWPFQLFKCKAT
jgi:hypothetical protein